MSIFSYEGVTITLKNPTGRDRMKLAQLRRLIDYWSIEDVDERLAVNECLHLLYLVDHVEGAFDFPIPYKNPTADSLKAFIDGVFQAHENLYVEWVDALNKARYGTQDDIELLPDRELTDEQKKMSDSNGREKVTA